MAWVLAALVFAFAAAAHVLIAARHGEQSFDNAVAAQFAYLALHGWGSSGIVGSTAFGDHFNPIFLLATPFFAAFPSALTLQLVKSAVFASVLPGVFLLARDMLGGDSGQSENRAGMAALTVVLLSPMFVISILADYHTETLAAGLIPWLLLAYQRRKLAVCLVLAFAVCMGKENLPLVVGGIGILALVEKRERRWWISLGAMGGLVFALGVFVVLPACGPEKGSIGSLLFSRLASAQGWGEALTDGSLWSWLGLLAASSCALWVFAPRTLWPLTPLLLQHGLSARVTERTFDYHYLAPILPLLAFATLAGLATLAVQRRRRVFGALLAANLLIFACLSGEHPDRGPGPLTRLAKLQSQGDVERLLAKIPADAPAWASLSTSTRLATRERLFLIESLTTKTYMTRLWPFDQTSILADPPAHGLIDARDANTREMPSGLHAVDAEGDIVLLAEKGQALVRTVIPRGEWVDAGKLKFQAGVGGNYRVKITEALVEDPLIELWLSGGDGPVESSRAHRLLFGQALQPGVYEARYLHPLRSPKAKINARVGGRWILLTQYE